MKKYKKVLGYKECPGRTGIYLTKWRDGTGDHTMKPEKTIMDGLLERVQAIEREMAVCLTDKELFSLSMEKANLEHVIQRINLQEEREYLEGLEKLVDDARRDVCKCLGEYAKAEKNLREIEEKFKINRGEK